VGVLAIKNLLQLLMYAFIRMHEFDQASFILMCIHSPVQKKYSLFLPCVWSVTCS